MSRAGWTQAAPGTSWSVISRSSIYVS
jgi:hypothetical protein